jgi:DNA-binding GntR family transcriptional regulator
MREIASQSGPSAEFAHARVAQALRDGIMSGHYAPGEVITLRKLAAHFDVSSMPVRDALRQLVAERALVVVNANRSVAVPLLDMTRLSDICAIRLNLEGMAAGMAADRATREQLSEIERALAASEAAGPTPDPAHNLRFHFAIYAASGSSVLVPLIESLWLQFGPYLRRVSDMVGTSLGTGDQHHREVVDALRARDAERARRAITRDISRAMDLLLNDGIGEGGAAPARRGAVL